MSHRDGCNQPNMPMALFYLSKATLRTQQPYSADLGLENTLPPSPQHPNNIWALHDYHECQVKLGRTLEAHIIEQQLRLAIAIPDVSMKSSCFCRLDISS
jgi:hypothetical protein